MGFPPVSAAFLAKNSSIQTERALTRGESQSRPLPPVLRMRNDLPNQPLFGYRQGVIGRAIVDNQDGEPMQVDFLQDPSEGIGGIQGGDEKGDFE